MASNFNVPGGSAKSDTSRRPPVIKNPLLSSQVTGLTLDDFAPGAVLLPAAPLPEILKDPAESTGLTRPAIFSAQTLGTGTVPELLQDTDNFSEIDLSESVTPSRPPLVEYNPLQDLEESDGRGPGLLVDGTGDLSSAATAAGAPSSSSYLQQTSALTAQFAAQLPNVASTVFSTFSRVIKGNSPAPPANEQQQASSFAYGAYDSQHEFQNTPHLYGGPAVPVGASLTPLINPSAFDPSASPSGVTVADQQLQAQSAAAVQPPLPPPTFYNPDQVASPVNISGPPPPALGLSTNTYRLGGSKKKTYAHIPGLSTTSQPSAGGVLPPAASVVPQHASVASVPFGSVAPPTHPSPDSQTLSTPAGVFPFTGDSSPLFPVAQPEVHRAEPPPAAESKGKPSLFGYIPTKIFDKLPIKPSFGGVEKKEEVAQFPEQGASIVDQFVELSVGSGQPQAAAAQYGSSTTGGPPLATPFVGGPPIAASYQPEAPSSSSFFAPSAPAASAVTNLQAPPPPPPIAPASLEPLQQPPPLFYSPGQIPTVAVAPPSGSAAKSNPYSSARRAPGVGPYKNPLAPIVAPTAGPVFLPNQLPPSAAQTLDQLKTQAVVSDTVAPVGVFPVQQTPVSIFNPVNVPTSTSLLTPATVGESTPGGTSTATVSQSSTAYTQEQFQLTAPLVPTFSTESFTPAGSNVQQFATPPVSIFNPLASVFPSSQASEADVKPVLPYPPAGTSESVFPPIISPPDQPDFAAPTSSNVPEDPAAPAANDAPWQAQFNSFNIPTSGLPQGNTDGTPARLDFPQSATAASTSFTQFIADADASLGVSKPIVVDSRSRSSENVLSPPPRPNSNLSEPATIFPGSVPPAGIFRSDTDASLSGAALFEDLGSSHYPQEQQQSHNRSAAQDSNANNASDFFTGSLPTAGIRPEESQRNVNFFLPSEEPSLHNSFAQPGPTPAINPTDFFNSNSSTVLLHEPAAASTSTKTGQTVSSVPLFSFFGRAADPTPTVEGQPTSSGERQQPTDQTDAVSGSTNGGGEALNEKPTAAAAAPSISNVSSFSNVNDRFEFGVVEEYAGDPEEEAPARIGNASNEPIFSSDNLFDFKSSAYRDGGFYSRTAGNELDANDGNSSMAAMATTSVGGPDTTTNTAGTSIAESANTNIAYRPTYNHWFYRREVEGKIMWSPFTMADSMALEDGLALAGATPAGAVDEDNPPAPVLVHTDGGRYDVSIRERQRMPVYWNGPSNEVRRCSWFYKNVDSRFVPYEEDVADLLEREYKEASTSGEWHRRVKIPNGETVVFHGPSVIVHFLQTQNPDTWGGGSSPVPSTTNRPRVVKRGIDEFNIDEDEPEKIDHLLFMVHGIGEACDLRFRRVEEVVDEFRSISAQLVQSHYRSSFDRGDVGRVEILPISWHDDLHSVESGVDEKLKSITLDSIPKLRHFTNDTLLDVLFYTSPMFCQSIIDAVGNSLNRLYTMFCQRNPTFNGRVSLAGHSLGSLILFDLLCHQKKADHKQTTEPENVENPDGDSVPPLPHHHAHVHHRPLVRKCSQQINYEVGPAGTGQPYITYPQLLFEPKMFFALGSPIGMFVTIRGIDALGLDFKLPTCDGFFNIFHPYDPVAYRIEALINPELRPLRPVLIPHHKGRKRMHLELKETMVRVSNDLKQRVSDVFRNTLDTVWALTAMSSRPDPKTIQKEVDKVLQDQLKFETTGSSSNLAGGSDVDSGETSLPLGQLNQTRRVDYVLQEAPFEFINEYLFALTSHVCYWDSEDTMLFVMKEIYSSLGVKSDHQVPQQSMTIERPLAGTSPAASSCSLSSNFNLFPQSSNR